MSVQETSGRAGSVASAAKVHPEGTGLKKGSLPLFHVVMQGVATIAPAFAIISTFQFAVGQAGLAAPFVYLIAFAIVLMIATTVGQLAKEVASAGGFSAYVSRALHPIAGFLTGWLFLIWLPPSAAILTGYFCEAVLEPQLKAEWGVTLPWWIPTLAIVALAVYLVYRGIALSARTVVALGLVEIAIVVVLALCALVSPGDGGVSLAPLNPGNASSGQGLYLGVVFSIFAFVGWEAVTPLAEETQDPRRNVPRALIYSVITLGIFFAITSWLFIVGLGTDDIAKIASAETNPVFTLANRLWGGAWVVLLLAMLNSVVAVSVACLNAGSRTFYALGRTGALPESVARVNRDGTPTVALVVQVVVTAVLIGVCAVWGSANAFAVFGLTITLGLILAYVAVNAGVLVYYRTTARDRFNPILHGVFPVAGSLAVAWVFYKSVSPLPEGPAGSAPIVIGGWMLLGAAVVLYKKATRDEAWLEKARAAVELAEGDEPEAWPARP